MRHRMTPLLWNPEVSPTACNADRLAGALSAPASRRRVLARLAGAAIAPAAVLVGGPRPAAAAPVGLRWGDVGVDELCTLEQALCRAGAPCPPPRSSCRLEVVAAPKRLPDGDRIEVRFERDAVPADEVEFRLESGPAVTWWKGLTVPDGEGGRWAVWTRDGRFGGDPGRGTAGPAVRLWAHQVRNGQRLTFAKAKFLGIPADVYTLGGLEGLRPGERVTFRWLED